jgi:hypothetical protein
MQAGFPVPAAQVLLWWRHFVACGGSMNVIRLVQRNIHPLTAGLFANWPPDQKVEVGDYGFVSRYQFVRSGSPRSWGMKYEVETIKAINANMEYSVHANLEASAVARPDLAGIASGVAKITFGDKGAFLYHLAGLGVQRLANQHEFAGRFMQHYLHEAILPDEDPVIVSEIRVARKSSIVVSDTRNAHLELQGNFPVTGQAMLAEIKGDLSLVRSRGTMFKWLAADQTIPLLGLIRPTIGGPGGAPLGMRMLEQIRDWISGGELHIRDIQVFTKPMEDGGAPVAKAELSNGARLEMHFDQVLIDDFEALNMLGVEAGIRDEVAPDREDDIVIAPAPAQAARPAEAAVAEEDDDMKDMIQAVSTSYEAER